MANGSGIGPQEINELIDKINKLTTAMENGLIGGKDGGGMYPFWRRKQKDEIFASFEELSKMERAYYHDMREKRKKELNDEIRDLENALNTLKSKRKKGQRKSFEESTNEKLLKEKKQEQKASQKNDNYYYDYKTNHIGSRGAWDRMSKKERAEWGSFNRFEQEGQFRSNSKRRRKLSESIYESGLGDTKFGRYAQSLISRTERMQDYGRFAGSISNKLGGAAAKMAAKGGKGAAVAAKGLGMFSKGLGTVSKLMGGPYVAAILAVIDALKAISAAVNEYKLYTAEMYQYQTKQEQLQYEKSKQTYTLENQLKIEQESYNGDMQLKMLDTQGATMLEALRITTEQYVKGVETAIGPLTKGINQSAYDAANARIDAAANIEKLGLHQKQREQDYRLYGEQRGLQYEGKKASINADIGIAEAQYTTGSRQLAFEQGLNASNRYVQNGLMGRDAKNEALVSDGYTISDGNRAGGKLVTGEDKNVITNIHDVGLQSDYQFGSGRAFLEEFGLDFGRQGDIAQARNKLEYQNQILTQTADWAKTTIDAEYQLEQTKKDYAVQVANKQLDIETQKKEIVIDAATEVKKTWLQLAQKTEQFVEQFDRVANNLGKNYGYTNARQLKAFQKQHLNAANDVTVFGKSYEDIAKLQQTYIETTGRNKLFSRSDNRSITALGEYLGDDGLAANYAAEMEIFNAGVAGSVDMLDKVLQDVNRIGLNGRKYTKTLVDSLKLAQKYNFKGGTENLMKMAKWAENTRFNMNALGGMLDKISEGGLEGVITQGAQFQVLGGQAAMNADPFAMMFERYADPEAFAKRMQDMTKGYGSLDRTTGETTFSGTEQMLMEQLAKIQGRSVEDVMNEVRARNKKEVVSKQLNGNFDEDEQSYISNVATYNKKTRQFEVKVQGKNGQYENKEVSQLTKEDLENLMPEKHDERMEDYMQTIVDLLGKMTGEENREKIDMTIATYEDVINNYAARLKQAYESYNKNRDIYIQKAKEGMEEATRAFSDYIKIFEDGNKDVQTAEDNITQQANAIGTALENTAKIINEANSKINGDYTPPDSSNQRINSSDPNSGNYRTPAATRQKLERALSMSRAIVQGAAASLKQANDSIQNRSFSGRMLATARQGTVFEKNTAVPFGSSTNQSDSILNPNNKSFTMTGKKTVKINDGLVQSDPKDVAIFAKEGGVIGNFLDKLYNDVHSSMGGRSIQLDTINIQISGSLDLSSGGQSVNIINELQNNPILLRTLSRMLTEQLSKALNGGRGSLPMSIGNV